VRLSLDRKNLQPLHLPAWMKRYPKPIRLKPLASLASSKDSKGSKD
jgi:hypothetical protein